MLVRATISVRSATQYVADSFENCVIKVAIDSSLLDVCVIYCPPPNTRNKLTTKQFITDFGSMLEEYVTSTGHVVLLGDFNFHLDNENDPQARQYFIHLTLCSMSNHQPIVQVIYLIVSSLGLARLVCHRSRLATWCQIIIWYSAPLPGQK